jgi:hypothetical protein
MSGVVLVVASSLAVLALLAFAVSLVAFLVQTSRHRSSRGWAVASAGFLVLVLFLGTISNVVSRQSGLTLVEQQSAPSNAVGQANHDAKVEVTRVVDGDTFDISPSVKGRSRVRLIGMDTPRSTSAPSPTGPRPAPSPNVS